jgi:hypothetical protein
MKSCVFSGPGLIGGRFSGSGSQGLECKDGSDMGVLGRQERPLSLQWKEWRISGSSGVPWTSGRFVLGISFVFSFRFSG